MLPITLVSSLFLAASAPPVPPQGGEIAIVGARVEIGDGQVLNNGTVVVRGSQIVLVGEGLPAPQGATVVDGKGLTVYPGFIDAYSTSGLNLPDPLPSGKDIPDTQTTAPATMWHENRKNIRADVKAAKALSLKGPFKEQYGQGITSVLVSSGTGSLAGTAAFVELTDTPKALAPDVAQEIVLRSGGGRFGGDDHAGGAHQDDMAGGQGRRSQTDDATPTYAYPGTLFGIYGLMRQTLSDAQYYAKQDKPKPDATYDGLVPLVTGRMPALFTLSNARDIARAGHLADEFGFKMIVNGAPDAYRMVDVLKRHDAPVIVSLDLPDEPRRTASTEPDSTPPRVLQDRYDAWKERMGNAKALNAAGIPLAFRSGSGGYLTGVRKLVAAGLPRDAALKAMTGGAASIFGVGGQLGSITVGKTANLVLMTGDFADDKSTVTATLVEGALHDLKKEPAK